MANLNPPPGSKTEQWALRGERGPASEVIAKIEAMPNMSAEDKAWFISRIVKSGFAGVKVDAQEHFYQGQTTFSANIKQLY